MAAAAAVMSLVCWARVKLLGGHPAPDPRSREGLREEETSRRHEQDRGHSGPQTTPLASGVQDDDIDEPADKRLDRPSRLDIGATHGSAAFAPFQQSVVPGELASVSPSAGSDTPFPYEGDGLPPACAWLFGPHAGVLGNRHVAVLFGDPPFLIGQV